MAKALKIKAKRNGYRRAGYRFSDTGDTTIELTELKKEQIEQLKADKNLLVAEVDIKPEKGGKEE